VRKDSLIVVPPCGVSFTLPRISADFQLGRNRSPQFPVLLYFLELDAGDGKRKADFGGGERMTDQKKKKEREGRAWEEDYFLQKYKPSGSVRLHVEMFWKVKGLLSPLLS